MQGPPSGNPWYNSNLEGPLAGFLSRELDLATRRLDPGAGWGKEEVFRHSFSGVDIRAIVHVDPFEDHNGRRRTTKELGTLQTLSVSVFRDKQQVRALGTVADKGVVRGPRTIAGSMIFTVFDEAVLAELLRIPRNDRDYQAPSDGNSFRWTQMDQLPAFDMTILFSNEYGGTSEMSLTGLDIHSEGQVMSIEDMITESTLQYTARNMVFMHRRGKRSSVHAEPEIMLPPVPKQVTFESILQSDSGEFHEILRNNNNQFR